MSHFCNDCIVLIVNQHCEFKKNDAFIPIQYFRPRWEFTPVEPHYEGKLGAPSLALIHQTKLKVSHTNKRSRLLLKNVKLQKLEVMIR
jgi:hypothetical protein